jgi:hypothetical protein
MVRSRWRAPPMATRSILPRGPPGQQENGVQVRFLVTNHSILVPLLLRTPAVSSTCWVLCLMRVRIQLAPLICVCIFLNVREVDLDNSVNAKH